MFTATTTQYLPLNIVPAGALDKFRKLGLTAPSATTVNRHKMFGKNSEGWPKCLVNELKAAMTAANVPPKAKYGFLAFDEIKVEEGLVYDPHSGLLIGKYCHNHSTFYNILFVWKYFLYVISYDITILLLGGTEGEIGTHVLQFFWSSLFYGFSYPLAYFVTWTADTEDLSAHFWKGVCLLDEAKLEVLAAIFDGSPANRRFQVCV